MQLHLKAKEAAWGGILMALAVILVILSSVIEASSLFLLAAASFITGIFQKRFKTRAGAVFLAGAFFTSLILAPQKLYCFTFAGLSVYVLVAGYLTSKNTPYAAAMVIKGICYHILLAAALVIVKYFIGFEALFTDGFMAGMFKMPALFIVVLIALAEALWIIFDKAYIFFQYRYDGIFGRWLDE